VSEPKPTEALLPCPFCGGKARRGIGTTHYIYCNRCRASSSVRAWNRRAAARSPAPEWKLISEAPKDGTRILGYAIADAEDTQPQIIQWDEDRACWVISWDGEPCTRESFGGDVPHNRPTHFMPLPSPPKEMT